MRHPSISSIRNELNSLNLSNDELTDEDIKENIDNIVQTIEYQKFMIQQSKQMNEQYEKNFTDVCKPERMNEIKNNLANTFDIINLYLH